MIRTENSVLDIRVREIDDTKMRATFVAATEGGVETWLGKEYLDMNGIQLDRFRKNPVILNSHKRNEIEDIVGRGTVSIEKDELILTAEFTVYFISASFCVFCG